MEVNTQHRVRTTSPTQNEQGAQTRVSTQKIHSVSFWSALFFSMGANFAAEGEKDPPANRFLDAELSLIRPDVVRACFSL